MNFCAVLSGFLLRAAAFRQKPLKRTLFARRLALPAIILSYSHDEPVHLVVDLHQRGTIGRAHGGGWVCSAAQTGFKRGFRRDNLLLINDWLKRSLKQLSNFFVIRFLRQDSVPVNDSPGVRIHHERRMISRIEQNRVGGLWANAVQAK